MKTKSALVLFLLSLNVYSQDVTCISVNCDLYRNEKKIFEGKLKEIGCENMTDKSSKCDQIKLAKITTDFSQKVTSIFKGPVISKFIKDDIQYNGLTNLFEAKPQNAPGVYEIVPVLDNPNIGVHWGGVVNYQALIDRLFNIDPAYPDVKNSNWYLTQWKKDTPLMLSDKRKDPIHSPGVTADAVLGLPAYEIDSPIGKYGTETSLRIYKHPSGHVFEIIGRNGWLNNVGGSNVFLSSDIVDKDHTQFTSDINLTFNGKLSKMKAKYGDNSSETKNEAVVGQAFAAFTAGNSETGTNLFVQIFFGDTRQNNILYTGCYMHGGASEIVYTHNIDDSDFKKMADDPSAPLQPKKYNLNRYLCEALSQKYKCTGGAKAPDFSQLKSDLSKWKIGGFYTGVETESAKALKDNQDVAGPIRGDVEMGLQYSSMRVSADTNIKFTDCNSVFNRKDPVVPIPDLPVVNTCSKGSFQDGDKKINWYCGCGDIAGGVKQANGCFHKIADAADTEIPPVQSKPSGCSEGTFKDGAGKLIGYSCGCGEVAGAVKQADGCFHFPAEAKPQPKPQQKPGAATYGSFCVGVKKTNFICNAGVQDKAEGWVDVGQGCYHQATGQECD